MNTQIVYVHEHNKKPTLTSFQETFQNLFLTGLMSKFHPAHFNNKSPINNPAFLRTKIDLYIDIGQEVTPETIAIAFNPKSSNEDICLYKNGFLKEILVQNENCQILFNKRDFFTHLKTIVEENKKLTIVEIAHLLQDDFNQQQRKLDYSNIENPKKFQEEAIFDFAYQKDINLNFIQAYNASLKNKKDHIDINRQIKLSLMIQSHSVFQRNNTIANLLNNINYVLNKKTNQNKFKIVAFIHHNQMIIEMKQPEEQFTHLQNFSAVNFQAKNDSVDVQSFYLAQNILNALSKMDKQTTALMTHVFKHYNYSCSLDYILNMLNANKRIDWYGYNGGSAIYSKCAPHNWIFDLLKTIKIVKNANDFITKHKDGYRHIHKHARELELAKPKDIKAFRNAIGLSKQGYKILLNQETFNGFKNEISDIVNEIFKLVINKTKS